MTSPTATLPDSAEDLQLTPRQVEILTLLKAGKANKEIARELGIGLGTVKQHMVVLFKKLNVTNRAMAVARGFGLEGHASASETGSRSAPESTLEWRPATVLSLAPGATAGEVWRRLQRTIAITAYDFDATVTTRPGGSDLIFGLHRVREDDAVRALRAVEAIAREAGEDCPLSASIVSGYLAASMFRNGGWTGEIVAGPTIAVARDLAVRAAPGRVLIGPTARYLLGFAERSVPGLRHLPRQGTEPLDLPLTAAAGLFRLPDEALRPSIRLLGRGREMTTLHDRIRALSLGKGGVILVEGDAGMGKTSLFAEAAALCATLSIPCRLVRCFLPGTGPVATTPIRADGATGPHLVLVDDAHWLSEAEIQELHALAEEAERSPVLLVLGSRPAGAAMLAELPGAERIRLSRLATAETLAIIADLDSGGLLNGETRSALAQLSSGVPLFAVELATEAVRRARTLKRAGTGVVSVPPTLAALVIGRLDALGVDRTLLRTIAGPGHLRLSELPAGDTFASEDIRRAVATGVLAATAETDTMLGFSHPLIRRVVRDLLTTNGLDMTKLMRAAPPAA